MHSLLIFARLWLAKIKSARPKTFTKFLNSHGVTTCKCKIQVHGHGQKHKRASTNCVLTILYGNLLSSFTHTMLPQCTTRRQLTIINAQQLIMCTQL